MLPSVGDLSFPLMAIFYMNSDSIIAEKKKENKICVQIQTKAQLHTKSI